jgi:hypothetical protein
VNHVRGRSALGPAIRRIRKPEGNVGLRSGAERKRRALLIVLVDGVQVGGGDFFDQGVDRVQILLLNYH